MPSQPIQGAKRPPRDLVLAVIALVAVACFAIGTSALWQHWRSDFHRPYRAPAGTVMILLAVIQLRIAWLLFTRRDRCHYGLLSLRSPFWQWMFVGLVTWYVIGLLLGPEPAVRYLVRAGVALWYTAALVPLSWSPALRDSAARWGRAPWLAWARRICVGTLIVAVVTEAGLRGYTIATDDPLQEAYVARLLKLPPQSRFHQGPVNALGYWGNEFVTDVTPGVFRIAVLGDGTTLSGTPTTNFLAQLVGTVPGIEVYNFGLRKASPREYAAQFLEDVVPYHPDLVIACISVGDDITQQVPVPGKYDWRGLSIYQAIARLRDEGQLCDRSCVGEVSLDRETFVRRVADRLAVCRTPMDAQMRRSWSDTLAHLNELARQSSRHKIPLGIMLLPGEFQVNAHLCNSARRHRAYEPHEIDLDLPQRRLQRFAAEHELPMLDLLPYLRATGQPAYERNAVEFNAHGNTVVAAAMSRWVQTNYAAQISAHSQAAAR